MTTSEDYPIRADVTKKEWDKAFWRSMEILARTHPTSDLEWRREEANRRTIRATGSLRPPSFRSVLISTFLALAKALALRPVTGGKSMKFSFKLNALKGAKTFVLSALTIAGLTFVDTLVTHVDTAPEMTEAIKAVGLPALLVPLGLAFVRMYLNWRKVQKLSKTQ